MPPTARARPATFIEAIQVNRRLGIDVTLCSETFQHTGSFKFRAAFNVAANVAQTHIIAASSGNFGQALAYACALLDKRATIVMPAGSARVKTEAVRNFGADVDLIDVAQVSRADRVRQLAEQYPDAYVASAYDDALVIEGNATLGVEISRAGAFDVVVAPVGGGGLTAGIVTGLLSEGAPTKVIGAEPAVANDAARSLRSGRLITNEIEPPTIADGARTVSLGRQNWAVLQSHMTDIVEVPEEHIARAGWELFYLANLKAEPTGALAYGALVVAPERFRDLRVCCVITGGNVDPVVYRRLIGE